MFKNIIMEKLAKRITSFISKYAQYSAHDPEEFNSPDAYCLLFSAEQIKRKEIPSYPNSSWESGGYEPYTSKEGRKEHDDILHEIKIIRSTLKVK